MKKIKVLLLVAALFVFCTISHSQNIGDSLHVVHYIINIDEINTTNKTIKANSSAFVTVVDADVQAIALELINLTVDSVWVDGKSAIFSHSDGVITINHALQVGDTAEARVFYHGQPFSENWGGFHFAGDYAFNLGVGFVSIPHNLGKAWFACIDDFTDRATYDLYARVDNSLKAIGGGLLVGTSDNGDGTTTWHWNLNQEIPTYLESVTVGDYVLVSDTFNGINGDIPISIYARPQDVDKVAGSFVNLKEICGIFEDHFGPYPFDRIGFTATSKGAMEHATNISYPYSGFSGNTGSEWWFTHELSHMWFGDMVTCSTAEDMWLNEGWATFCQILYTQDLYDEETYKTTFRDKLKEVLMKTHIIDGGYYAVNNIPQEITYGSTAYDKGSVVAAALRAYLGDSTFFSAITAYLQNFAYQSASSYDMRDFLSQETGIDMTGFFDNWVFSPGTPHYAFDSLRITPENGQYKIDIYPKQKHKGYDFIGNDNKVLISYLKDDFSLQDDTIMFSGLIDHSVKYLDYEPLAVLVDPMEKMMDASIDNYKVFAQAEDFVFPDTYFKIMIEQIQDSAFIQAVCNWAAPDMMKAEVQDLILSPNRFWSVNGFMPDGMSSQGRFYYDNSIYLDADLIQSASDSVVVLYRQDAADDWHSVPQEKMGIWSVGYIFVNDLQLGEYTLAVYKNSVGEKENKLEGFNIYPNPNRGRFNYSFTGKGDYILKINSLNGQLIDSVRVSNLTGNWKPLNGNINPDVYILSVYKDEKLIGSTKLVIVK